jgi:hypothetical protein
VCGDGHVQRIPSATRLNVSHQTPDAAGPPPSDLPPSDKKPDAGTALQAMYWSAVRHVMQTTEDVGERFATEARAMHAGELPAKPIRGQLDADDREALKEEGIEVMSLLVPKGFDGPVQ